MPPPTAREWPANPEGADAWVHHFHNNVQPIEELCVPELADQYPECEEAIFLAYMLETTFTVKVYVNYDERMQRFFFDSTLAFCAKLDPDVSPLIYCLLENVYFHKFRFIISSYLDVMYEVDFQVQNEDPRLFKDPRGFDLSGTFNEDYWLSAIGRIRRFDAGHMDLYDFVANTVLKMNGLSALFCGVRLKRLQNLAAKFLNRPDDVEFAWIGRLSQGRVYRYLADWRHYQDDPEAIEVLSYGWSGEPGTYDRRYDRRYRLVTTIEVHAEGGTAPWVAQMPGGA